MRAALSQHCGKIEVVRAQLALARTNKATLEGQISKAHAAKARVNEIVDADAASLVERMRRGLEWTLSSIKGIDRADVDARIAGSQHQIEVAERAFASIDREIARSEVELQTLQENKPAFVAAAAREAADGFYADYATAADNLREIMTQLAGLDAALGAPRPGRLVAVLPDLAGSSGLDELPVLAPPGAIADAAAVWRKFVEALAADPRAPVSMLEFAPVDPIAPDHSCYHEKHPLERRVIDVAFAKLKG
jgi:hypothetical protein